MATWNRPRCLLLGPTASLTRHSAGLLQRRSPPPTSKDVVNEVNEVNEVVFGDGVAATAAVVAAEGLEAPPSSVPSSLPDVLEAADCD